MRVQPLSVNVNSLLVKYANAFSASGHPALDVAKVVNYGRFVGSVIEHHEVLDRAMDRARQIITEAARENRSVASGTVIVADRMTASKGRFTRSWHAPEGGLWGCMIHGNDMLPKTRQFIPMSAGLAACEALREHGVQKATLRWVNDVLVEGQKIAGFLVEGFVEPLRSEEFTLVGFGINVNNCVFPEELKGMALSCKQFLNQEIAITPFSETFLARLAWNFGLLYHEEAKDLAGEGYSGRNEQNFLLQRWQEMSDTIGQRVLYGFDVMTNPQYEANVLGVDENGGLQLQLDDGYTKTEYSGEVRYL